MKVISEKISKMRQKVEKCKINFELCRNHFQRALKSFSVVTENGFQVPKLTFDDSKTFVGPKNVFVFLFQRGGYFPDEIVGMCYAQTLTAPSSLCQA